ncbi:FAD/NAD(P)-binding oxidoreductase [Advenella sp. FME57]|uniref:Flavocytochrome C n=1 Tax=Advenella kashmirensis TaxID=310575 RepID=A0A356LBC1_9BURK|nr:FAD/NAD(P)-binding oxidoreductase [Advenella sp. FME57]HBP28310.1 flavocytochrome C [Advenella kashmirensis]
MKRRQFINTLGAAWLGAGVWPLSASAARSLRQAHVVIVGAGFAGATAAKYLRMWSQYQLSVTLIEQNAQFVSCPTSNLVLGGSVPLSAITRSYDNLIRKHGVTVRQETVLAVDPDRKQVRTAAGPVSYDYLIMAPGISFDYSQLPMTQTDAAKARVPHAWKAGPQTQALARQLQHMRKGGVFAITVPPLPYRCPPGPYERACQVAWYLKQHNPTGKVLVLDANPGITSKRALFERNWAEQYAGLIDYQPGSELSAIDVDTGTVKTVFDTWKTDVLNVIAPQAAGRLALDTGLSNEEGRWCDVDFVTYESRKAPGIHLLGDSVDSGLPKSAHIANSQAKVCASSMIARLAGAQPDPLPVFANTCYSYVDDTSAMHVANVYRYDPEKMDMVSAQGGGLSAHPSEKEGADARSWAKNIWSDTLD